MARYPFKTKELIRDKLRRKFEIHCSDWALQWLFGCEVKLAPIDIRPEKNKAFSSFGEYESFLRTWRQEEEGLEVTWEDVSWFGNEKAERIPTQVKFQSIGDLARFLGKAEFLQWQRATTRLAVIAEERKPEISQHFGIDWNVLAQSDEEEFKRLKDVVLWLADNRQFNGYMREIPVEGLDTKWLEGHLGIVCRILGLIVGHEIRTTAFFTEWKIRSPEPLIKVRGIPPLKGHDYAAFTAEHLSGCKPERLFITENLQTGLAIDIPEGTMAIFGLGNGIKLLGSISWIRDIPIYYMGDLDQHGLRILSELREIAPQAKAVMMDSATLRKWGKYAVEDPTKEISLSKTDGLTDEETKLFKELQEKKLRLEQERIPITEINKAFASMAAG